MSNIEIRTGTVKSYIIDLEDILIKAMGFGNEYCRVILLGRTKHKISDFSVYTIGIQHLASRLIHNKFMINIKGNHIAYIGHFINDGDDPTDITKSFNRTLEEIYNKIFSRYTGVYSLGPIRIFDKFIEITAYELNDNVSIEMVKYVEEEPEIKELEVPFEDLLKCCVSNMMKLDIVDRELSVAVNYTTKGNIVTNIAILLTTSIVKFLQPIKHCRFTLKIDPFDKERQIWAQSDFNGSVYNCNDKVDLYIEELGITKIESVDVDSTENKLIIKGK